MELITPGLGLIFWMTISFSFVLVILRKYAWKPILANIRTRERKIAKSLITARKIDEDLQKMEKLKIERVAEAEKTAMEMLQQANLEAGTIVEQARKKAIQEASKILDEANKTIEAQKHAALLAIKSQVADLSLELAEKVLQEEFSDVEKSSKYIHQLLDKVMLN